jgi:hypothetical protein
MEKVGSVRIVSIRGKKSILGQPDPAWFGNGIRSRDVDGATLLVLSACGTNFCLFQKLFSSWTVLNVPIESV